MLSIDLVTVPYDSGRRGYRMGAGPQALLRQGLMQRLRTAGHEVELVPVEAAATTQDALSIGMDLAGRIARVTRASRASRRFPLTLSGNCFGTVGAFASAASETSGVMWFDAHGDVNTPETSASGFLDGMAAATLLGWCHADRTRDVLPSPLAESRLLLAGVRDLDAPEATALEKSSVRRLSTGEAGDPAAAGAALDAFTAPLTSLYVHVDVDVLDPERVGPANSYAAPGGLSAAEVIALIDGAGSRTPIAGMTVSSYDPAVDGDGRVGSAAIDIIVAALAAAMHAAD